MQGQQFKTQDETLLAAKLLQRLHVKNGVMHLDKTPIPITLPGDKGDEGSPGNSPEHQWDGAKLRFKLPDKTWGPWVDLKGTKGDGGKTPKKGVHYKDGKDGDPGHTPKKNEDYFDGKPGKPPAHRWSGTCLSFQNPDGTWGEEVDLKGVAGDFKKGPIGNMPAHEWRGPLIRFQNPDGSWDKWKDLKGEPGKGLKGDKGDTPIKGVHYDDGKPGKNAKLPEALDMTVMINGDLVLDESGAFKLKKKFAQIRIYPKG